jgi:hypothetical protein
MSLHNLNFYIVKIFTLDQKCIINVASSILGVKWGVGGSLIKSRLYQGTKVSVFIRT